MLSGSEKGVLVLGLINFFLLLLEIPFLYYVIKIIMSTFRLYFRALFGTFFLKVFLE